MTVSDNLGGGGRAAVLGRIVIDDFDPDFTSFRAAQLYSLRLQDFAVEPLPDLFQCRGVALHGQLQRSQNDQFFPRSFLPIRRTDLRDLFLQQTCKTVPLLGPTARIAADALLPAMLSGRRRTVSIVSGIRHQFLHSLETSFRFQSTRSTVCLPG